MDADFHGGWTKCEEIHSSDKEWNSALQLPSASPAAPPAAAPTRAAPLERVPPPPSTPPPAAAPPATKPAAAPSIKPAAAPPASLDPQTIERIKRERLLQDLRKRTAANGQYGIRALSRAFYKMDKKSKGFVGREDTYYGFQQQALPINAKELDILIKTFERNNDGKFYYKNFIRVLRGPLSEARKAIIHRAFRSLRLDGAGEISLKDIKLCYDAARHPSVSTGAKTVESVLRQFKHHWNETGGPDESVGYAEFEDYFADLSANIGDDRDFEVIVTAWKDKPPAPVDTTPAKAFGARNTRSPSNRIRMSPGGKTTIAFSGGKVTPRVAVRGSQKRATGDTAGGNSSIVFG